MPIEFFGEYFPFVAIFTNCIGGFYIFCGKQFSVYTLQGVSVQIDWQSVY